MRTYVPAALTGIMALSISVLSGQPLEYLDWDIPESEACKEGYSLSGVVDRYGNVDLSWAWEALTAPSLPDSPAGWREDERLSLNDARESISPRGVSDTLGRIHVVWKDNRRLHGRDEIHYRVRIDTTWDTLLAISNLDTAHNSPWIAVDRKRNLHVVFLRWFGASGAYYDLGYRKYDDSLSLWEPEERVTFYDSIGLSGRPRVLCDTNDVVYAFWLDERDVPMTIWYVTNDGTGWAPKRPVTDSTDSPNGYYGVAVAPDNVIHCVFQDYRSGTAELYHRYYQGAVWTASTAVTANGFTSAYPRLSPDTLSNMHLVYGGGASLNEKIHYLIWDSFTQTWGPETIFPSQMAIPHVDIAVSPLDSDVHLTFHESLSGQIEIMYKHYDAQTSQWEPNVRLTFNEPDIRLDPQICLDPDDFVHLFWWDERDLTGQEEIYYKTNRVVTGIEEEGRGTKHPLDFARDRQASGIRLLQTYPNPFRRATTITYHLTRGRGDAGTRRRGSRIEDPGSHMTLGVYDLSGRLIRTLLDDEQISGFEFRISVPWDGTDEAGRPMSSGVYLCRLTAGGFSSTTQLVLLR